MLQDVQCLSVLRVRALQFGHALILVIQTTTQTGDRLAKQPNDEGLKRRGSHGRTSNR
jgi:hypothetical protein